MKVTHTFLEGTDYNLFIKRKDLNSELQWIISFALKVNDITIGILNIDCIDKNCKDIDLNSVLKNSTINKILNQYSEQLSSHQKIRIILSKNN